MPVYSRPALLIFQIKVLEPSLHFLPKAIPAGLHTMGFHPQQFRRFPLLLLNLALPRGHCLHRHLGFLVLVRESDPLTFKPLNGLALLFNGVAPRFQPLIALMLTHLHLLCPFAHHIAQHFLGIGNFLEATLKFERTLRCDFNTVIERLPAAVDVEQGVLHVGNVAAVLLFLLIQKGNVTRPAFHLIIQSR